MDSTKPTCTFLNCSHAARSYCITCEQLSSLPLTTTQVRKITDHDPVLAKVKQYTLKGWPATVTDKQLQFYSSKRDELSLKDGIPLWARVVVPPQACDTVMEEVNLD